MQLLSMENCCGDKRFYRKYQPLTQKPDKQSDSDTTLDSNKGANLERWQEFLDLESSEELTEEKINTTLDVFTTWREKNSITMLIPDDLGDCLNLLQRTHLCTSDEYFKIASSIPICQKSFPLPETGPRHSTSILKNKPLPPPPEPETESSEYVSGIENSCGSGESITSGEFNGPN